MAKSPLLTDIETMRKRAREHMHRSAVTESYQADRPTVLKHLNDALATEIAWVLRYKRHYFMASGIHAERVASEFLQHANEEQTHADQSAQRIVQLEGAPDLSPDSLSACSHSDYVEGRDLADMIREDLAAERIAIDTCRETINYPGNDDPATRRMREGIPAMEEEHAEDLPSMLDKDAKLRSQVS